MTAYVSLSLLHTENGRRLWVSVGDNCGCGNRQFCKEPSRVPESVMNECKTVGFSQSCGLACSLPSIVVGLCGKGVDSRLTG